MGVVGTFSGCRNRCIRERRRLGRLVEEEVVVGRACDLLIA